MKKRYKAIIFDLGGVLSVSKRHEDMEGVHEEVAEKLGFSVDEYFDAIDSSYANAIAGKISREKSVETMSRNLNTNPKKLIKTYKRAYKRNFKRNDELYHFALALKKEGYKIAIISDIWYIAKDVFFKSYYYRHFDDTLASCDAGSRKSGRKIFQMELKKLGLKPSEVIFTDNEKWNLPAPRAMGIKTILFKGNRDFKEQLKKLGVEV